MKTPDYLGLIKGLMKDELREKIMTKFFELKAKIYSYLVNDGSEDTKKT